ncbi:MAG: hypothetical protein COW71_07540 [Ignavibacteriales bacterium CG18_big_fil_WC_8_21_14_2_50_31_20]|nr:MAG: hypothetical protein COW71_07540 [Ignavibacteriales bacterium CG18_big_fil_WC_8_21_14_2_50_31_20]
MLKTKERNELEANLIMVLISSGIRFKELYTSRYRIEHLFKNKDLRELFVAITKYYEKTNELPIAHFQLREFGDFKYTWEEYSIESTIETYRDAEKILIDDYFEWETIALQREIKNIGLKGLDYLDALNAGANKLLMSIEKQYFEVDKGNAEKINDLLTDIKNSDKNSKYIKTGFNLIDAKTNGIPKGHLSIIAGRPGMGKTSFMLQLSNNIIEQGLKVGIISIEMTFNELQIKNISHLTKIDSRIIENGSFDNMNLALIETEAEKLKSDNYIIDDNSFQTPQSIKATLRRWIMNKQIDIVFIDYLTLIRINYSKGRNDLEIGALTQDLREFAKETKLPIVMLSQLNRAVEGRNDKKPYLSDLRESGSIEQDANLVMFVHRPSYYGIDPYQTDYLNMNLTNDDCFVDAEDIASIIIAKARNGQTGTVPLQYIPKYHSFENIEIRTQLKKVSKGDYPF